MSFQTDLRYSHDQSDKEWWEKVYRDFFPNVEAIVDLRKNGWHQQAGRDRAIILSNGKTIYIDEKVRRIKDTGDILLEIWSTVSKENRFNRNPGWAIKDLDTDWIAYAFEPSQRLYMFNALQLRQTLLNNYSHWEKLVEKKEQGFNLVVADNGVYETHSWAIPTDVLYQAMAQASVMGWGVPEVASKVA